MEKKTNVKLTVTTPRGTYFGEPALLTDTEVEKFETLIQQAVGGELESLSFNLEMDNGTVYLPKKLIMKSSFVIRKS